MFNQEQRLDFFFWDVRVRMVWDSLSFGFPTMKDFPYQHWHYPSW